MTTSDTELVGRQELAWRRLRDLCAGLTEAEWAAPTECPGWDVKDNVAHIAGLEHRLLHNPPPPPETLDISAVHHQLSAWNRADVELRRPWPAERLLAELDEVTAGRRAVLAGSTDIDFGADSWTPVGRASVRELLASRILDTWVHDQDIRRAVGRPGHQDGPVADHTLGRLIAGLPFVIGKRVAPPDGTTVTFDLAGPAFPGGRRIAVGVAGGRAKLVEPPAGPTATLTLEEDDFVRLTCGRGDPDAIAGGVGIAGDGTLGRDVLRHMNFMP